jgi:endonuclease/exonuclease/phosphatase family metal-dependent hydrolase
MTRKTLLLLLVTATLACRASSTPLPSPDVAWLRVMSFNIAAGNGNLTGIADVIRGESPDVVALQEVDVHWSARSGFADQAADLSRLLGMHVRFAPIYSLPPLQPGQPRREYGVALLSRFPVVAWSNDTLTRLSTQDSLPAPRRMPGLLSATVDVRGTRVRVYSTHTDYRPDPRVRAMQNAEMLALIARSPLPTILVGDLNAPPSAPELQPLFARLLDAWSVSGGDGFTYPAGNPVRRIDYVLTSQHFRAIAARVPPTTASDHRPVVVELARPNRR